MSSNAAAEAGEEELQAMTAELQVQLVECEMLEYASVGSHPRRHESRVDLLLLLLLLLLLRAWQPAPRPAWPPPSTPPRWPPRRPAPTCSGASSASTS
jgi:hypothetical protein